MVAGEPAGALGDVGPDAGRVSLRDAGRRSTRASGAVDSPYVAASAANGAHGAMANSAAPTGAPTNSLVTISVPEIRLLAASRRSGSTTVGTSAPIAGSTRISPAVTNAVTT